MSQEIQGEEAQSWFVEDAETDFEKHTGGYPAENRVGMCSPLITPDEFNRG